MIESIHDTGSFITWRVGHHNGLGQELLVVQLQHFRRAFEKNPANYSKLLCTLAPFYF